MIRVEFPQPAPLLNMNDRHHWAPRARWTKEWRYVTTTHTSVMLGRTRRAPVGAVIVQLYLPVKNSRRRDPHNFTPTLKACVDGIVDAGVIPDDNSDWCTTLEPILVPGAKTVVIEIRART